MPKHTDDDLFKDSVMTFGEHLEELRRSLWRAVIGVAVGFLLGVFVAKYVVLEIQEPMVAALKQYYLELDREEYLQSHPDATEEELENFLNRRMVFESVYVEPRELARAIESLREGTTPNVEPTPPSRLAEPGQLAEIFLWRSVDDDPRTKLVSLAGQETFMIWFKAAFVTGFVLASPWVFYQLWLFVAAGLYGHEKRFVYVFLPFSIGLFLLGVYTSLWVFEPVLQFFLSFNRSMGINPEPRISEWLSFVIMLPLGFGVAFQMPLVMLFLQRIGVMSVSSYLANWRISVMAIWVISAILTPADPTSIFFLAMPLMFLYFGGILLCQWWPGVKGRG